MTKVVRVLIYEGDARFVRQSLAHTAVPLNGVMQAMSSVITQVEDAACLVCEKLTNNLSIVCDTCLEERADLAREIEVK